MNKHRKEEILIGLLFLMAMGVYMIGSELVVNSMDNQTGMLNSLSALRVGIFLECLNTGAVVGLGALFFRRISSVSPWIAVAYSSSRIIEGVLLLLSSISIALLTRVENPQAFSTIAFAFRDLNFQMAMIALGMGSIPLCYVLFREKLIPRILSLVGIIGYIALAFSGFLGLFGIHSISMALFIPGSIFEIGLPIYLLLKGFRK